MSFDPRQLADPVFFSRLENLELRAQGIVEGFMHGLHRSPFVGFSVEFASHREYAQGDDLRHVNWKIFARQNRLYVKQFDAETNMNLYLLLDVSGSMSYSGAAQAQTETKTSLSKIEYASVLAASLAFLMHRQRDACGLMAFDEKIAVRVPASARRGQLHTILVALERLTTGRRSDVARPLQQLAEALVRRSMVVLISDLLDEPEPIIKGLKHLRFRGSDVVVFQIRHPDELTFPFHASARFRDLESAEAVTADPRGIRAR